MPRNDGKLEPGQKLNGAITARSWNRMVDAAEIVLGAPQDFSADGVQGPAAPNHTILCRNDSGAAVGRWGVLAITGMVIAPSGATGAALLSWQTSPAAIGVTPATGATGASGATGAATPGYVVAVEPIAAGKLGRTAVAGVVQAKVDVSGASHGFATPKTGSTDVFISATSGPFKILWKQGTGSGQWALLRIGDGAGATSSGGPIKKGTFAGPWNKNATNTVTSGGTTYTVTNIGVPIGTTVSGQNCLFTQIGEEYQLVYADTAQIIRGTFDAPWVKDTTTSVTATDGQTYTAYNPYGTAFRNGTLPDYERDIRRCAIAYIGTQWVVVDAECLA